MVYAPAQDAPVARKLLDGLGVEPLSPAFTVQQLYAGLRASRAPIKQVLLAAKWWWVWAIFTLVKCCSRWAFVPLRLFVQWVCVRVQRLHRAIGEVLQQAIERWLQLA